MSLWEVSDKHFGRHLKIRTEIVIFSESHEPEIDCSHAGMTDQSHSFIGRLETRGFIAKSSGREVQDAIGLQCIGVWHILEVSDVPRVCF